MVHERFNSLMHLLNQHTVCRLSTETACVGAKIKVTAGYPREVDLQNRDHHFGRARIMHQASRSHVVLRGLRFRIELRQSSDHHNEPPDISLYVGGDNWSSSTQWILKESHSHIQLHALCGFSAQTE